jgi:hypothetical protein
MATKERPVAVAARDRSATIAIACSPVDHVARSRCEAVATPR